MRVLVTGGAGYVGSATVQLLLEKGHHVAVLDDLSTGHRPAVAEGAALEIGSYGDSTHVRDVVERHGVEAVLHCAAKSRVSESVENPALYYRENVGGGIVLLETLRAAGVRRVVFSSTAAVYGTPERTPITEDMVPAPISPYGETKLAFERALRWYGVAYGFRSVSLRYFNVAGASGRFGEAHEPETHLIPNVLAAAAGDAGLTLFGDDFPTPDGTCVRDYIHVLDLARAHLLALEATAPGDERTAEPLVCNLGTGTGFSNREIVTAAERVTGRRIERRVGPRRAGDPPVLVASAARAGEVLAWQPSHSTLEEMVGSAWEWRVAHPNGYGDAG